MSISHIPFPKWILEDERTFKLYKLMDYQNVKCAYGALHLLINKIVDLSRDTGSIENINPVLLFTNSGIAETPEEAMKFFFAAIESGWLDGETLRIYRWADIMLPLNRGRLRSAYKRIRDKELKRHQLELDNLIKLRSDKIINDITYFDKCAELHEIHAYNISSIEARRQEALAGIDSSSDESLEKSCGLRKAGIVNPTLKRSELCSRPDLPAMPSFMRDEETSSKGKAMIDEYFAMQFE